MEKIIEKLIISLLNRGSINRDTANELLTEMGSKYPNYTPDFISVYAYINRSGASTATAICQYAGINEASLSSMVKSGFLTKNLDNSYSVA